MEDVARLIDLAVRLKSAATEFESVLEAAEEQLNEMNLGLDVWVGNPHDGWEEPRLIAEAMPEESDGKREKRGYLLGYALLNGKWRLVARPAVVITTFDGHGESYETIADGPPVPLVNAPVTVRAFAGGSLGLLFRTLGEKIEECMANFGDAKHVVAARSGQ